MGKVKYIGISIENNKQVYNPCDNVDGHVIIEIKGELKINSLKIYLKGIGKVHWSETSGKYTEHYRCEKEYINLKQIIIDAKDSPSNSNELIYEGRHTFPFHFTLPRNGLVTSFEGKHGSARYYLKAELDKSWALNNVIKMPFTVIIPIDINRSEYLVPVQNDAIKTVCCWIFSSGPIKLEVQTDRRGYCPGETILLQAYFENKSNRNIIPKAILCQLQKYNANNKNKTTKNIVKTIIGDQINANFVDYWRGKELKIPPISPSISSALIKVEYYIKVSLLIPASYSLDCILPIVIGTVPLRRNSSSIAQIQLLPAEYPQLNYEHPADDPPSYSQITSSNDEDNNFNYDKNYVPLYTYVSDYVAPPPYCSYKSPNLQSNSDDIIL